ncbi:GAF domain-containing protein [Micromonospora chalcea]|uniref:GAF domain-containing protein n=1 Tax=Micromonospora chalcea TaxID=1874 RepID=UPI0033C81938
MSAKTGWRRGLELVFTGVRYGLLVALPGVVALFGGFAGMRQGVARTNLIYASAVSAISFAGLNILKDLQARKASKSAVETALSLNSSTQPLLTLLGRVAEAKKMDDRRSHAYALMTRVVGIAHAQAVTNVGKGSNLRSVYYHFGDATRLVYQYSEGRDDPKPRLEFVAREGKGKAEDNDRKVVELARGDASVLIKDVDKAPPSYYSDYEGRPYKSFYMVPVRTDKRSFGFLSVDADKPEVLTKVDVEYAIVLARILATGLALLGGDYPSLGGGYVPPPQRNSTKQPAEEVL